MTAEGEDLYDDLDDKTNHGKIYNDIDGRELHNSIGRGNLYVNIGDSRPTLAMAVPPRILPRTKDNTIEESKEKEPFSCKQFCSVRLMLITAHIVIAVLVAVVVIVLYYVVTDCGSVAAIGNGNVVMDNDNVGGIANYSCQNGFFLKGNWQRICLENRTWSGTTPSCSNNVPTSYQVIDRTVTCAQVRTTTVSNNQQLLTCIDIFVEGNIRFPNGDGCYTVWRSGLSVSLGSKQRLDLPSLCSIMGQQLLGVAILVDIQVLWGCIRGVETRAMFVNNQWGTVYDNGYLKSLKCLFTV